MYNLFKNMIQFLKNAQRIIPLFYSRGPSALSIVVKFIILVDVCAKNNRDCANNAKDKYDKN